VVIYSAVGSSIANSALALDGKELVGKPVPDFHLLNYKQEIVSLSSFKGKVVLLVFWFPGCWGSEAALPLLEPLYQKYKSEGFEILAVDVLANNPKSLAFIARHEMNYVFLEGINREAMEVFKIEGTPSFFIIDRNLIVRCYRAGFVPGDERKLETEIRLELQRSK
jgi:peroxiredoxin